MAERVLKLKVKRDPIRTHVYIPCSHPLKERYDRLKHELDQKGYESLHEQARDELSRLMDLIEQALKSK